MAGDLSKSTKALRPVQSNRSERRDNYFSATLTTVSLYSPLDNQLSERDGNERSQTVVCAPRIFFITAYRAGGGEREAMNKISVTNAGSINYNLITGRSQVALANYYKSFASTRSNEILSILLLPIFSRSASNCKQFRQRRRNGFN